jgi:hypothetical protein
MKYFIDTEFIEDGKTIDLISIGIVCEDGRELYLGNKECNFSKASDWVINNVLIPMGFVRMPKQAWIEGFMRPIDPIFWVSKRAILEELLIFFAPNSITDDKRTATRAAEDDYAEVEIWGYYADYDWVVFCQLFGTMMDLPKGFPMYCRDIKQECDRLGNPRLPEQGDGEHNALEDARWNQKAYQFLCNLT